MANPEHVKILKNGAKECNEWKKAHHDVELDLRGADLRGANLSGADLRGANLFEVNLSGADLSRADLSKTKLIRAKLIGANLYKAYLSGADLNGADLIGANLSKAKLINKAYLSRVDFSGANLIRANLGEANLSFAKLIRADLRGADLSGADLFEVNLSGAVVDQHTNCWRAKRCTIGLNGVYVETTDSAALMPLTPPGDSMIGANASAVVDSLKQARSLHVFSMTLAAFVFYIAVLKPEQIKLPLIDDKVSTDQFGLFAMPFSIGLLTLVASFMSDALRGARYLQSRDDAMKVGQFPWALSRFPGKSWLNKRLSYLTRFVMASHPLVYLFFWFGNRWSYNKGVFIGFGVILYFLSRWVFSISQGFQRPILFDRKTEEERQSDLAKLAKSVDEQTKAMEEQTKAVTELITLLKPEQSLSSGANGSPEEQTKIMTKLITHPELPRLPDTEQSVGSEENDAEVVLKE